MNDLFSIFNKYPDLISAISEEKDGSMILKGNAVQIQQAIQNRKKFLNKLGININSLVSAGLNHKNRVEIVAAKDRGQIIPETDGLLTAEKNLFLTITVADCLPVFIYTPEKEIVGLIHCGWRNLAENILASAVKKLTDNFHSTAENILAGIGPGISKCHFEVKQDVLNKFKPFLPTASVNNNGKTFLDLKKIAEIQLLNLGLRKENIEINPDCTYCLKDKYFSFRRDKPKNIQAMLAVSGIWLSQE